jgi:hypothetical protein
MDTQQRRSRLDLLTPAELSIVKVVEEIEKLGADINLTNAVNHLHMAKNCVSDFVDGIPPKGFYERLLDEKNEVDSRSAKLEMFLRTDKAKEIDPVQLSLLNVQLLAMQAYSRCLLERLVYLQ